LLDHETVQHNDLSLNLFNPKEGDRSARGLERRKAKSKENLSYRSQRLVIAIEAELVLVDQEVSLKNHRFLHTLSQNHNVEQFNAGKQAKEWMSANKQTRETKENL
jgi:hypothetical protein